MSLQQELSINQRVWLAYRADCRIRKLRPKTIQNYYETFRDAELFLEMKFVECSKFDIQEYLADCVENLASTSVRTRYIGLRVFYQWAVKEGLVAVSPMDDIAKPQIEDVAPRIISDNDVRALLSVCRGSTLADRRDLAIIRLMLEPGGPRRAEIVNLDVADVDQDNEIIAVTGKGGKSRYIPYGAKTSQALLRYLVAREKHPKASEPALWLSRWGRRPSLMWLAQMLRARCQQAGIQYINPHALRHKAADSAMSAGISDLDMMTLFGWSSPKMLEVYARSNKTARAIQSAREKAVADRY